MLPPFAEDKETVLTHLEEFGFARIPNALDNDELTEAKQRLEEQAAAERRIGHATLDGWSQKTILNHAPDRFAELPPGPNQRIWNLINKGEVFRKIAMKKYTLDLVKTLLSDLPDRGDDILLSSFTANIANPGGADMQIHSDQGFAPDATPYPIVANIMWMLDDFTKENGATRVVRGSHRKIAPRPQKKRADSVAVTGPAGSALIFDGRLWHGTGSNTSDQSRLGILSYYCRPFIRQQENFTVSLAPAVLEQCSKELCKLLGFRTWGTLGMVERGPDNNSEGRILGADEWVRRPTSYVTQLK